MQSSSSSLLGNKLRTSCIWALILVVITIVTVGTRYYFFGKSDEVDWALAPWFFDTHDNSGGIHDRTNFTSTFHLNGGGDSGGAANNKNRNGTTATNNTTVVPYHHIEHDMELLFVGNSYTAVNDVATITKTIIETQWNSNVSIRSHHPGGQTFKGHLADATRKDDNSNTHHHLHSNELREWLVTKPNSYDWVILQEQSQIPGFWGGVSPEYDDSLAACIGLDELVQQIPPNNDRATGTKGTRTMFFLTWGRRLRDDRNPTIYPDFLTHQWRLSQGYHYYLEETSKPDRLTFIAPVGLVFEAIYLNIQQQGLDPLDPSSLFYQLYGSDGSHPSMYGSYLAGLTMYASMLGDDPREVEWIPDGLDVDMAKQIQRAVAWTILDTVEQMGIIYPWQIELP